MVTNIRDIQDVETMTRLRSRTEAAASLGIPIILNLEETVVLARLFEALQRKVS